MATIFGKITQSGTIKPVELVVIGIAGTQIVTESDVNGSYQLQVPVSDSITLTINHVGYRDVSYTISDLKGGQRRLINFSLEIASSDIEVVVRESRIQDAGIVQDQVDELRLLPSASGNFESVLPAIALGTFGGTGGELTSQYNVRGGNYDENLVYVNDFEVYRPQLISNNRQEGLSFPNIALIDHLNFSSGGFKSSYGDKLSSVLDIHYKRPDSTAASLEASLLGLSAHLEGRLNVAGRPMRYLIGARYRSSRYLLNTLDTEGEYNPNFTDIQTYLTYDFHKNWQVGLLANFNRAAYRFVPTSRVTATGLINLSLRLSTDYEGGEFDEFTTGMTGLSVTWLPENQKNPVYLKMLASAYRSDENEQYDIIGHYRLSQIDIAPGSENAGEEVAVLGTGTQHNYVRNFLNLNSFNIQHKGGIEFNNDQNHRSVTTSHFVEWGVKVQREMIDDRLNEWERLDSALYSLPYDPEHLTLYSVLKSENQLETNRLTGFLQNTFTRINWGKSETQVTLGVRANYGDQNKEWLISPRLQILMKPLAWKPNISFKLSGGYYAQPPYYREMRAPDGQLNTNLRAQKSWHAVAGMTWNFSWKAMSNRDFRLIAELYYKELWDQVSYEVDNVRLRYSGLNDARGYVTGFDMRINGEFIPGTESWINLSYLRAREQILGVDHARIGKNGSEPEPVNHVPRPSDQAFTLSMFFQDYLVMNDRFGLHLNFIWGSGLPFGVKDNNVVLRNTFRYRPYYRVDAGFSFLIYDRDREGESQQHLLRFTRRSWVSLDVFNMLDAANNASKTWIKTIYGQQFAISNFLTGRRLSLRLRVDF